MKKYILLIAVILLTLFTFSSQAWAVIVSRVPQTADSASQSSPYNLVVSKPLNTTESEIMFTWVAWYSTGGTTIDSVPSGWTSLASYTAQSDKYALYYKVATSSEPTSYTWSFSATVKAKIVCTTYYGHFKITAPIDVYSNTSYRTPDAINRAATMTASAINAPLIFFGGVYSNNASRTQTKPSVPTSDWVEDYDNWNTNGDFALEICSMVWTSSGASGNMDSTISATMTTKHAFAVALNPPTVPNIDEGFEATGSPKYDNTGWTESGTVEADYNSADSKQCSYHSYITCTTDADCNLLYPLETCVASGAERFQANVVTTALAYSEYDNGSDAAISYATVYFSYNGTFTPNLATNGYKTVMSGYSAAATMDYFTTLYCTSGTCSDNTNLIYALVYYNGAGATCTGSIYTGTSNYCYINSSIKPVANKVVRFGVKYIYTDATHGTIAFKIDDSSGMKNLFTSADVAVAVPRLGVRKWRLGPSTNGSCTINTLYDNFSLDSVILDFKHYNYGSCNGTNSIAASGTTCNFTRYYCGIEDYSTYEASVITRSNASCTYAACGVTADTCYTFPASNPDGIEELYNQNAFEITDKYAPTATTQKSLIKYIQALIPSRRVSIYNDEYNFSYGNVIKDGSYDGVQIINLYKSGSGTSIPPVGDTNDALFTFILPPYFTIAGPCTGRAANGRYPIVVFHPGGAQTINNSLYNWDNTDEGTRQVLYSLVRTVAKSSDQGRYGVIGVISNVGGEYNLGLNQEYVDAFALMVTELYTNLCGDRDRVVTLGVSRGGGVSLKLTAEDSNRSEYKIVGVYAGAPATAIGSHTKAEDTDWPHMQTHYPRETGYLNWEDYTKADLAWKYSSQIPPHCTSSTTCGDSYAAIGSPILNSTVVSTLDSYGYSPIGYCDTEAHCKLAYGGYCTGATSTGCVVDGDCGANGPCIGKRDFVLTVGTNDGIIPLHEYLKFDQKLRDYAIPHKTCVYFRGGHTGEYARCIWGTWGATEEKLGDLQTNILDYLANDLTRSSPDGRDYWNCNTTTHAISDVVEFGTEAEGYKLPFIALVPTVLDNSIDSNENCTAILTPYLCCLSAGTGTCTSQYNTYQQPAQILAAGDNGKGWYIEILDSNHNPIADQTPTKIWQGVFGTNSCGAGCTCLDYSNEWCLIGSADPTLGVQYECTSPPCTYYYSFKYGTVSDLLPVSSFYTPYKTRVGMNDPFNRIDNDSLGSDWVEDDTGTDLEIISNAVKNTTTTHAIAHHVIPTVDANQWGCIKLSTVSVTGLVFRSEASSGNRYVVMAVTGTNAVRWYLFNWNTQSTQIGITTLAFSNNDIMCATLQGIAADATQKVKIWKNPAKKTPYSVDYWDSASDVPDITLDGTASATATVGKYIGIYSYSVSGIIDDFYGGDFPTTTSKELQTIVKDYQPTYGQIYSTISGNNNWNMNFGICQLPSCGDNVCSAIEDSASCPEDCRQDNFNDDADLSAVKWVEDVTDLTISSSAVTNTTNTVGIAHWAKPNADLTQYGKFKIATTSTDGDVGVILRSLLATGTGDNRYAIVYDEGAGAIRWDKYDWNSYVGTPDQYPVNLADGAIVSVTIEGTGSGTKIRIWTDATNNAPYDVSHWQDATDVPNDTLLCYSGPCDADTGTYAGVLIKKETGIASPTLDDFYSGDTSLVGGNIPCFMRHYKGRRN